MKSIGGGEDWKIGGVGVEVVMLAQDVIPGLHFQTS